VIASLPTVVISTIEMFLLTYLLTYLLTDILTWFWLDCYHGLD